MIWVVSSSHACWRARCAAVWVSCVTPCALRHEGWIRQGQAIAFDVIVAILMCESLTTTPVSALCSLDYAPSTPLRWWAPSKVLRAMRDSVRTTILLRLASANVAVLRSLLSSCNRQHRRSFSLTNRTSSRRLQLSQLARQTRWVPPPHCRTFPKRRQQIQRRGKGPGKGTVRHVKPTSSARQMSFPLRVSRFRAHGFLDLRLGRCQHRCCW